MPSTNFNTFIKNPIVNNLYVQGFEFDLIVPGNPEFITTEDGVIISTESGIGIVTEG